MIRKPALRRLLRILSVTVLVLGAAAARSAEPLIADDAAAATAEAGFGAAFGRIFVVEDGKEKEISGFFGTSELSIRLRSVASGETQIVWLKGDGSFRWPLKPGEYVIATMHYQSGSARLWSSFSVPQAGQAVYVGSLRVQSERGGFRVGFVDQYDAMLKQEESWLAQTRREAVKGLMRPEPRLGTYQRMFPICATGSGIECNNRYQGLEAVLPEGTADHYPTTDSLRPLLEWKPSTRPNVSYDVAIYEADLTGVVDVPGAPRERGKLVLYAEALPEHRFRPDAPLPAGKKFMWSVRLRDGDAVSTWTLSSYFTFFIIGYKRGWNQWYAFATPEQSADSRTGQGDPAK